MMTAEAAVFDANGYLTETGATIVTSCYIVEL
jgi:hypothetical protein